MIRARAIARLASAAALLALAACGNDRAFPESHNNSLVVDPKVTDSVEVLTVRESPGLAAALVAALAERDVLATAGTVGGPALRVWGRVEGGALVWRILDPADKTLATARQTLPAGGIAGADARLLAEAAAPIVIDELRGGGAAAAPDTRTPVVVRARVPAGYDGHVLAQTMADRLAGLGIRVAEAGPASVEGVMRILPGAGGNDVVQLDWVVRGTTGAVLGTVSQGSPVPRDSLAPGQGFDSMARDIATAGAPAVARVIKAKLAAPKPQ